jgi:hypothetical protein
MTKFPYTNLFIRQSVAKIGLSGAASKRCPNTTSKLAILMATLDRQLNPSL